MLLLVSLITITSIFWCQNKLTIYLIHSNIILKTSSSNSIINLKYFIIIIILLILNSMSCEGKKFDLDSVFPPDYDNLIPPKENDKPTVVRFHVWVLGLDSIDEGSMTYVADIFMSQSWKDHRLRIPDELASNNNSYRLLPISWIKRMWRPDSFYKNAKQVTFQEMTIPNHYIWLYPDKTILYMVKLTLLLSCAMKFQSYPHDTQNCSLKIESLSYTTDDLIFDWELQTPLAVDDSIELPQHDMIGKHIGDCTQVYSSGNFTCVQVVFTLQRRIGYYIFHTYIPTCLIVIMSWISFWIKPEAVPARVTLCVTSLLTLSTQHAQSQKSLPPVSYIKAIDYFMSACTLFVFASLMEYAVVNIFMADIDVQERYHTFMNMSTHHFTHQNTHQHHHPHQNQNTRSSSATSGIGIATGAASTGTASTGTASTGTASAETNSARNAIPTTTYKGHRYNGQHWSNKAREGHRKAMLVDRISRWIFPLFFVILNIIYWAVYLS